MNGSGRPRHLAHDDLAGLDDGSGFSLRIDVLVRE